MKVHRKVGKKPTLSKQRFKRTIKVVKRSDDAKGFEVIPKRWIVERTFGWFSKYPRLSKDSDVQADRSEAMIRIAMISLMTHRLHPG